MEEGKNIKESEIQFTVWLQSTFNREIKKAKL